MVHGSWLTCKMQQFARTLHKNRQLPRIIKSSTLIKERRKAKKERLKEEEKRRKRGKRKRRRKKRRRRTRRRRKISKYIQDSLFLPDKFQVSPFLPESLANEAFISAMSKF